MQDAKSPAYYGATLDQFRASSDAEILGTLTSASGFAVDTPDRDAWLEEIAILRRETHGLTGHVFLEFDVPRLGSRIDAVLVVDGVLLVLEFKCGAEQFRLADYNQAWDYALDLKNFHLASHEVEIFPMLVATRAAESESYWSARADDGVFRPLRVNGSGILQAVNTALARVQLNVPDAVLWATSRYSPSPSIIEAAQSLYARHSVESISRSDAGAKNLAVTADRVEEIVRNARESKRKAIIFVTGVPGAGKTLVGLNVATQHRRQDEPTHAVFLSGNAPLVAVLQEALIRDELGRRRAGGEKVRKGVVAQEVKPFIQNVHRFRDEGLRRPSDAPDDHVVIFDEAQRAWNREKAADFMKRRKKISGFNESEPEFLISYMDRHPDWAAIVCLVGGGQEIHTGEAGIGAWLEAVRTRFPHWWLHISPHLVDSEYSAGEALAPLTDYARLAFDDGLHLSVSMRSFRAEQVSSFVKALLDSDMDTARALIGRFGRKYPIVLTRDLDAARTWIRAKARGSERYGLVASSQAQRLKPHAIDIRVDIDPIHWFLGPSSDTRSSFYLEDAATEFQVQGLELDWMLVTWDADLRRSDGDWSYHDFRGAAWRNINQLVRRQYLINAYRVLLTRARQGMVIFVPPGDPSDHTRSPEFYDETFDYLLSTGMQQLAAAE